MCTWWWVTYLGKLKGNLVVFISGSVLCSEQQQLLDKCALVPASGMMQSCVFAVICLGYISSMLRVFLKKKHTHT